MSEQSRLAILPTPAEEENRDPDGRAEDLQHNVAGDFEEGI
jgi:hypothetical protein